MIVKASKIAGLTILVVGLIVAGLIGGAVWRLYQGPVSLAFAAPVMDRALNWAELGFEVDFADTILTWDREERTLEIHATDLTVAENGAVVAGVPEASVRFSVTALLAGRIAPTEIELIEPAVSLLRRETGEIVLLRAAQGSQEAGRFLTALIAALRRPAGEVPGLEYFTGLSVTSADVTLQDMASGTTWRAPDARLALRRQAGALTGEASGRVINGNFGITVALDGIYNRREDTVSARIDIENLNPAEAPPRLLPYPDLAGLDMPLVLTAEVTSRLDAPPRVRMEIVGEDGTLTLPDHLDAPISIDRLSFQGQYEGMEQRLRIERLDLRSDGTTLASDGILSLGEVPALTLVAEGQDLTVAKLKSIWPETFKPNTRAWITRNFLSGRFDRFSATVDIGNLIAPPDPLPAEAFTLNFRFSDLKATYLSSLPAIEAAEGYGRLDMTLLDATVQSARTMDLTIPEARIRIDDLNIRGEQDADIEVVTQGPIASALTLLNNPPLEYPDKFGIRPDSVLGTGATRAHFEFPVIKSLGLSDVSFAAASTLTDVALPELFENTTADDGRLNLRVGPAGIEAEGTLSIADVPFDVTWAESFDPDAETPSRYTLAATLDDENWGKLALPFDERVRGPATITLRLEGQGKTIAEGVGDLDLTPATMTIAEFGWEKGGDEKAGIDFRFETADTGIEVTDYILAAPGLASAGRLSLDADFAAKHVAASLSAGRTQMDLDIYGRTDGGFEVFADGETLDIRPLLGNAMAETETTPYPSLILNGQFERVLAHNAVAFENVAASAHFIQGWWEKGRIFAGGADGGDFSLTLDREGVGRTVTMTSGDAGKMMKALDFYRNGEGGRLSLEATIDDSKSARPVTGRATIRDITVRDAPVMAKLLSLASFTGIADTLSGEGIHFDKVAIPFTYRNDIFSLTDAGAFGPAIGFTVEGRVDRGTDTIDLGGSIIPSYTLNSLLGKIPILGPIFSGKEGEGLIGFTYRVKGSAEAPEIAVNPLSALAPGFLRGIFSGIDAPETGTGAPEDVTEGMDAPVD